MLAVTEIVFMAVTQLEKSDHIVVYKIPHPAIKRLNR